MARRSTSWWSCPKADEDAIRQWTAEAILKGRGTKHFREGQRLAPLPEPLSDFLFCEAVEFAVLPWHLDEMDVETFAYWSQVIGIYRDERAKRELQRQKSEQGSRKR